MIAEWQTKLCRDGFPIEHAALGNFSLTVAFLGGEWQWLVQQGEHDLAEGAARAEHAARQQAEAVASRLLAASTN